MKTIVVPGEQIGNATRQSNSVLVNNNKSYSKYLGVLYNSDDKLQVVPLQGKYIPKEGDLIIGLVYAEDNFGYILDVKSSTMPYISKRAIRSELKQGDFLLCEVNSVNEIKQMTISIQSKLEDGFLLQVPSKKVPRVIGKHKSMISLLEKYSESKILVGANGFIFVKDGKANIVKDALEIINRYSHVDNLTEKMDVYLKKKWSR